MSEKNRIAVIVDDVALPGEKGLNRIFYLSELLCANGYDVDLYTGDFQHWEKRYRDLEKVKEIDCACNIINVHQYAYQKNLTVKRIFGYRKMAKEIRALVSKEDYKAIYCQIPDNYMASTMAAYAKKAGIPFVIDVEDLWPEAMKMVFNVPVISNVLFSYFSLNAKKAYRLSDGIIGSSDDYRDMYKKYGADIPNTVTVYVGMDKKTFDEGVEMYSGEIEKPENEFWVTYAGSLGSSYDIGTLVRAAAVLKDRGDKEVRVKILGDGPLRAEFEAAAKESGAPADFLGYMDYKKMAAYLSKSDITVNSIVKNGPHSIVSKIGDYLAAGKPMINTCMNPEFWNKVENDGYGRNVEPENVQAMAELIADMKADKEACGEMGRRAMEIGVSQFDRAKSYLKIEKLISDTIKSGKKEAAL